MQLAKYSKISTKQVSDQSILNATSMYKNRDCWDNINFAQKHKIAN